MTWQIESSLAPAETSLYAVHAGRISKGIARWFGAPASQAPFGDLMLCRTAWQFADACASKGYPEKPSAHISGICIKSDGGDIAVAILCGNQAIHDVLDVISHECFHAFSKSSFARDLPMWLEEGLAMDFGAARFTERGLTTGHVDAWRLETLQNLDDHTMRADIRGAFASEPEDWQAAARLDPGKSQKMYGFSWLLMHTMMHSGDLNRQQAVVRLLKDAAIDRTDSLPLNGDRIVSAAIDWLDQLSADPTAIATRRLTELSLGLQLLHEERITPPDSLMSLQSKMRLLIAEYRMHSPGGPPRRVRMDRDELYWYPDDQGLDFEFDQVGSPKGCPFLSLEASALPDRPRLTWFNTRGREWSPRVILGSDPILDHDAAPA